MRCSFNSLMGANPTEDKRYAYETSWAFSPLVFAILRAVISLYAFFTIFFIFGWHGTHGENRANGSSFSYFTNLSYWGIAFYFLVAAIHTFLYNATGRSVLFEKLPRFFRALHSLFYTTVTNFPFLVVIVYWAVLFEGDWYAEVFDAWTNISQHAMPALFSLFEIIFSTAPVRPWLHLAFLIIILLLYLSLAYLTHATQGFYTYSFLNPGENGEHNKRVVAYSFGIAGATIVIYCVVNLLLWIRVRFTREKTKFSRFTPASGQLSQMENGMAEVPK